MLSLSVSLFSNTHSRAPSLSHTTHHTHTHAHVQWFRDGLVFKAHRLCVSQALKEFVGSTMLSLSLALSLSVSNTHTHTHTRSRSVPHHISLPHSLTRALSLSHTTHSLALSLSLTHSHSLTHSLSLAGAEGVCGFDHDAARADRQAGRCHHRLVPLAGNLISNTKQ